MDIRKSCDLLHKRFPVIKVDEEILSDEAIIYNITKLKCPNNDIEGKGNILLFQI